MFSVTRAWMCGRQRRTAKLLTNGGGMDEEWRYILLILRIFYYDTESWNGSAEMEQGFFVCMDHVERERRRERETLTNLKIRSVKHPANDGRHRNARVVYSLKC